MKQTVLSALVILLAFSLFGCGGTQNAPVAASDQSGHTWQITLRAQEIRESLHTDAGVRQYGGSILDVDYNDSPSDGQVYLILTLTVTKSAAGGGGFDWSKLCVADADGHTYARMDDAFLANHTYNRMKGSTLQIGENKGSICFEIPESAAKGTLTLQYDAGDEGVVTLPIR